MKLVELLATKLDKWADTTVCYVQDSDGSVWPCTEKPNCQGGSWVGSGNFIDQSEKAEMLYLDISDDNCTTIVTRAQWQSERDRQKGGEWKRHRGNKLPIDGGLYIEAKLRCGDIQRGFAQDFIWPHAACDVEVNLMKYRVISQPQEEEVEVNVRVDSAVNVEYAFGAPDADMSKLDWRVLGSCNLDSIEFPTQGEIIHGPISMGDEVIAPAHPKWDQVDGPLLWRDTVNELDACIEEFTREREVLINRLAEEGFALIPAVTPVMGASDVDMSDWRNWKAGDIVEVEIENDCDFPVGSRHLVAGIERPDYDGGMPVKVKDEQGCEYWPEDSQYDLRPVFKFIRRP